MRLVGLTLALLASSLGARAESIEDRVAALEARVKALEAALQGQVARPALTAASIEGSYKATLDGKLITLELSKGKATVSFGNDSKAGTYEIAGQRVVVTADGKAETLTIEGDHLRGDAGNNKTIEFFKTP